MRKEELTDGRKTLRLWMHEVGRVFGDRLISEQDKTELYNRIFIATRDKIKDDML